MKGNVDISVIIPVYNSELYVGRCIRSLLDQTISKENYEIIVINDGSTDNTKKALENFKDDIKYFENKKNLGLPATLNKGIKKAKGRFIVRVDSDDWVHQEYLNILSLHLSLNNSFDAVACDYMLVNNEQEPIRQVEWSKEPIGCGVMFKLQHLIKIGLYDEDFLAKEDEDLLIRFQNSFKIIKLRLPLYKYRQHNNNMTKNSNLINKYKKKLKIKHKI